MRARHIITIGCAFLLCLAGGGQAIADNSQCINPNNWTYHGNDGSDPYFTCGALTCAMSSGNSGNTTLTDWGGTQTCEDFSSGGINPTACAAIYGNIPVDSFTYCLNSGAQWTGSNTFSCTPQNPVLCSGSIVAVQSPQSNLRCHSLSPGYTELTKSNCTQTLKDLINTLF